MDQRESLNFVKRFRDEIVGNLSLRKLILFGSRARGDFNEDSDFDLIVVSDEFEGIRSFERMGRLGLRKYWGYKYPVDMVCLTSKEFEKWKDNRQTFIGLAVSEGVEI
jgi:uncharacterized protein